MPLAYARDDDEFTVRMITNTVAGLIRDAPFIQAAIKKLQMCLTLSVSSPNQDTLDETLWIYRYFFAIYIHHIYTPYGFVIYLHKYVYVNHVKSVVCMQIFLINLQIIFVE